MKLAALALVALSIVAITSQAHADDSKSLQGTWKLTAVEAVGNPVEVKTFSLDAIVIEGNTLALKKGDEELSKVTFTLDESTSPKQMIWTAEEKGSLPVIYELKGKTLRVCFPLQEASKENDIPAPEGFDTTGKRLALLTAERS